MVRAGPACHLRWSPPCRVTAAHRTAAPLADNQLGAIEATLGAKEHDYEELLLMSHDASHAKDVTRAELLRLTSLVSEEREAREKEVAERRNAVQVPRARAAAPAQQRAAAPQPQPLATPAPVRAPPPPFWCGADGHPAVRAGAFGDERADGGAREDAPRDCARLAGRFGRAG